MRNVAVQFLAGKAFEMVVNGNALAQGFMSLQRQGAAQ